MHQLSPLILGLALFASPSLGHAHDAPVPSSTHLSDDAQTCRAVAELAKKYDVPTKLPESVAADTPCPRREAAKCLRDLMEKVLAKCEEEGKGAVPQEDLDRLDALYESLKTEMPDYEGYQSRREAIERMLAKPEFPPYAYKVGVNGFLRGEGTGNFRLTDFSYTPGRGEGRFLYRVKPYAYWHPTDWLDIHAEGQGYGYNGGSQGFARFSLYQGFVEAKLPGSDLLALKAGRQEFSYGSTFILGPDSFYDGLTFDGARLRIRPLEPLAVDILAGAYARPWSGGFSGNQAGGYATWTFSEGNAVEAYFFHDTGATDRRDGQYLNTWGLRGTAGIGPVTFELEPVYESGKIYAPPFGAKESVSAYGGHFDVNFDTTFGGTHNHFFVSYAYGSGDRAAATGGTPKGEFRNPNNDTSLVGDMNVIGDFSGVTVAGHHASGLQVYTLGWGGDILKEMNLSVTGRYFRANDVENGFSRHLGLETDCTLTWTVSDGLSLVAGYDHFFTGGFFRDATGSGRDIDYGYVMVQFDLSHAKPKPPRRGKP